MLAEMSSCCSFTSNTKWKQWLPPISPATSPVCSPASSSGPSGQHDLHPYFFLHSISSLCELTFAQALDKLLQSQENPTHIMILFPCHLIWSFLIVPIPETSTTVHPDLTTRKPWCSSLAPSYLSSARFPLSPSFAQFHLSKSCWVFPL